MLLKYTTIIYYNNLGINSLIHTRRFLLTLADIDHRLNQIQTGYITTFVLFYFTSK